MANSVKIVEQHKQIFKLASDIIEAREKEENINGNSLAKTLDFLVNYASQNFSDEEKEKVHGDFHTAVGELRRKYVIDGISDELKNKVNTAIVKWLLKHIGGIDAKIARYIKDCETRKQEMETRNKNII